MLKSRLLRLGLVLVAVVLLGVLAMPGRLWMGQRVDIAEAQEQLVEVKAENRRLKERVAMLSSDSLIEREARERFDRVYPGDESYTVPAAGPIELHLPEVWPFTAVEPSLQDVANGR
ncbi:MAG: septum formation initiator family protein [Actinobacteria bacterium]|nr:septum formation initiator family protein [Actinomycetota bacterium]